MSTRETVTCVEVRNELTDYLENALSEGYRNEFERHLDRCCSCRNHLGEILDCIEELGRLRVDDLTPEREAELVALISDRREQALEVGGSPEARAEEMLEELMAHSPEQRAILLRNCGRFRSVGLCEMALDRGFEVGAQNPALAAELSSLGAAIADSLEEGAYPFGVVLDLRATAYAFVANAKRIGSDLAGASEALEKSRRLLESHAANPSVVATVLAFQGSLLGEQLRFEEALESLDRAIEIFRGEGDAIEAVRASLVKAMHLANSGKPEAAVRSLEHVHTEVEELGVSRLSLAVKHNLAFSLFACGRVDEVKQLLPEIKELHLASGNAVDLMRFRWLEGEVAVDSGRLSEAESVFLEVKQFFVDKGMAHDVAFVSLDLALVYLRQGRIVELKALAAEMLTIFRALKIPEEALAALIFCQKAVEMESLTFGVVNELVARLEEARRRSRFGVGLSVTD